MTLSPGNITLTLPSVIFPSSSAYLPTHYRSSFLSFAIASSVAQRLLRLSPKLPVNFTGRCNTIIRQRIIDDLNGCLSPSIERATSASTWTPTASLRQLRSMLPSFRYEPHESNPSVTHHASPPRIRLGRTTSSPLPISR